MKKRIDLLLVDQKKVTSRTKAQDLIKSGAIWILENEVWKQIQSSNQTVDEFSQIEIRDSQWDRFVSRGAFKLEGALKELKFSVQGLQALDVGLSTGGFADCLLQAGAAHVVGVDVGHGQLHPKLQKHPQLQSLEGINARELHQNPQVLASMPQGGWDLIVVDVSFISLALVLPAISSVLKSHGHLLALVKPQFEVGAEGLGKGGLVKDSSLYAEVEKKIRQKCLEVNLSVRDYLNSSIEGKDGNREFFIFAQKN
ncbi:MAG: TlyA family RNA methyltransferase [Pseudobdellovibrionaceae bacterium]